MNQVRSAGVWPAAVTAGQGSWGAPPPPAQLAEGCPRLGLTPRISDLPQSAQSETQDAPACEELSTDDLQDRCVGGGGHQHIIQRD